MGSAYSSIMAMRDLALFLVIPRTPCFVGIKYDLLYSANSTGSVSELGFQSDQCRWFAQLIMNKNDVFPKRAVFEDGNGGEIVKLAAGQDGFADATFSSLSMILVSEVSNCELGFSIW